MAGDDGVIGDHPLVNGMSRSVRLRRDFTVTDADRLLATARRAYRELNPGASAEEACQMVSCLADALFVILGHTGLLGVVALDDADWLDPDRVPSQIRRRWRPRLAPTGDGERRHTTYYNQHMPPLRGRCEFCGRDIGADHKVYCPYRQLRPAKTAVASSTSISRIWWSGPTSGTLPPTLSSRAGAVRHSRLTRAIAEHPVHRA